MAPVQAPVQMPQISQPRQIPQKVQIPNMPAANPASRILNSHLTLDAYSPVNQNGSFEFDRVLKSGCVMKRTRKTKAWKSIFLVLRPNYLSIYKDQNEAKLRHKINLSDLTAVAFLKDPKQKRQNMFGLFSPSRNYHLEAASRKDAEEWVDLIRQEARIEEEEEEMMLASPAANITSSYAGLDRAMQEQKEQQRKLHDERLGSSSPEPIEPIPRPLKNMAPDLLNQRRQSHTIEYSGNELVSDADMSDTDFTRAKRLSNIPLSSSDPFAVQPPASSSSTSAPSQPIVNTRNLSQTSGINVEPDKDPERVVWQGYLLYLRSAGGVKQWKDLWVVIRPKNVAIYKNNSEYAPRRILPFSTVINVVEIDPLSKTKTHCLQIITEEKTYKFCAHNEEDLDKSLGACKSLLAKRKEVEGKRAIR